MDWELVASIAVFAALFAAWTVHLVRGWRGRPEPESLEVAAPPFDHGFAGWRAERIEWVDR